MAENLDAKTGAVWVEMKGNCLASWMAEMTAGMVVKMVALMVGLMVALMAYRMVGLMGWKKAMLRVVWKEKSMVEQRALMKAVWTDRKTAEKMDPKMADKMAALRVEPMVETTVPLLAD